MSDQIPTLLSAFVSDAIGLAGGQGAVAGFAMGAMLSQLMARRRRAAEEILISELRKGEVSLSSAQMEEGVAIIYRYARAAQEGAARLNLRLLAQAVAGRAYQGNLKADEFLYYADMISSLRREEIFLLAKMHCAWSSVWITEIEEGKRSNAALEWCEAKLVPGVIPDRLELEAIAGGVSRTGLIQPISAVGGDMRYKSTPLLSKLVDLTSIDAAIENEGTN